MKGSEMIDVFIHIPGELASPGIAWGNGNPGLVRRTSLGERNMPLAWDPIIRYIIQRANT